MKSVFKWAIPCLLVYVLFLIIKLPAVQVLARLPLPEDIELNGVSGTIWNGQARQLLVRGLPIEQLSWQLEFLPLLTGTVQVYVDGGNIRQMDEISIKGDISLAEDQLQADNLQLYLPTDWVIASLALPIAVNASGRFKLILQELDYSDHCQVLNGKGHWLKAQVQGNGQQIALGNFDADLSCVNQEIVLTVNEPNRFGLSAVARIPADLTFSVSGRFKPDPDLPPEVHQAAQFFGQKDGQGYYSLQF
ncbi:MAG: general secretion pathway protein N [Paraglaciecola sp.]|jgi:general secretion pathway protein N